MKLIGRGHSDNNYSNHIISNFWIVLKNRIWRLCLESLQETHEFSFDNYTELVSAFLHFTEKMRRNRSGSITEDEKQEWFVLKLHVHKEEIQKKISGGHMKELVKWFFSDV